MRGLQLKVNATQSSDRIGSERPASLKLSSLMHQADKQSFMYSRWRGTPQIFLRYNICAENAMLMTCIYLWNKESAQTFCRKPAVLSQKIARSRFSCTDAFSVVMQRNETRDWRFKDAALQQGAWQNKSRITAEENLSTTITDVTLKTGRALFNTLESITSGCFMKRILISCSYTLSSGGLGKEMSHLDL